MSVCDTNIDKTLRLIQTDFMTEKEYFTIHSKFSKKLPPARTKTSGNSSSRIRCRKRRIRSWYQLRDSTHIRLHGKCAGVGNHHWSDGTDSAKGSRSYTQGKKCRRRNIRWIGFSKFGQLALKRYTSEGKQSWETIIYRRSLGNWSNDHQGPGAR